MTRKRYMWLTRETTERHQHAAGCKKTPSECERCQEAIRFFDALPLQDLAIALQDGRRRRRQQRSPQHQSESRSCSQFRNGTRTH